MNDEQLTYMDEEATQFTCFEEDEYTKFDNGDAFHPYMSTAHHS